MRVIWGKELSLKLEQDSLFFYEYWVCVWFEYDTFSPFFDNFRWNSACNSDFGFWLFLILCTDFDRKLTMSGEPRQWRPFRLQGLQHQFNADVHAVKRGANRPGTTRIGRFLDFGKYPYFHVEFQTATTPPLLLQIDRESIQIHQTRPALQDAAAQSTMRLDPDHSSSTSGNG